MKFSTMISIRHSSSIAYSYGDLPVPWIQVGPIRVVTEGSNPLLFSGRIGISITNMSCKKRIFYMMVSFHRRAFCETTVPKRHLAGDHVCIMLDDD